MTHAFSTWPLSAGTRRALESMAISTPTPIQVGAIPALLEGRDLIGQAKTGSGKTLAFAVPMVERVDPTLRRVQALVLLPTRELALQVANVVSTLAGRRLRTVAIFGGRAMGPQTDALRAGAQIVIGTPGRVLDHLRQRTLDLSHVRYLVLDEADEMLDRGFAPDVERILGFTPATRQTALFSATVPEWVGGMAARHLREPVTVRVDTAPEDAPRIEQTVYAVRDAARTDALRRLLDQKRDGQAIVFGKTKHGVRKLARQLETQGYQVAALQGNLSQNARDRVMAEFRSGRLPVLLATNVAARGIDVDTVDLVVNYELPENADLFTHRIGRTGRMGRMGRAITLLTSIDADKWRQLARDLGPERTPPVAVFPGPEGEGADLGAFAARRSSLPRPAAQAQPRPTAAAQSRPSGPARPRPLAAPTEAGRDARHGHRRRPAASPAPAANSRPAATPPAAASRPAATPPPAPMRAGRRPGTPEVAPTRPAARAAGRPATQPTPARPPRQVPAARPAAPEARPPQPRPAAVKPAPSRPTTSSPAALPARPRW